MNKYDLLLQKLHQLEIKENFNKKIIEDQIKANNLEINDLENKISSSEQEKAELSKFIEYFNNKPKFHLNLIKEVIKNLRFCFGYSLVFLIPGLIFITINPTLTFVGLGLFAFFSLLSLIFYHSCFKLFQYRLNNRSKETIEMELEQNAELLKSLNESLKTTIRTNEDLTRDLTITENEITNCFKSITLVEDTKAKAIAEIIKLPKAEKLLDESFEQNETIKLTRNFYEEIK